MFGARSSRRRDWKRDSKFYAASVGAATLGKGEYKL
jgi:hypothetical protein